MKELELEFNIFKIFGYWRPIEYFSTKKVLYDIYSLVMTFIMYTYMLSGCFDVIFNAKNIDDVTANCFMMLTIVGSCCKAGTMLIKHNEIVKLTKNLRDDIFLPQNEAERKIQEKFDKKRR